jgi:DNA-binding MarR family transcriptional regulator
MTDMQYKVMMAISSYRKVNKIPPTLREIGEIVGSTSQNVGVIIKKLIAMGRVQRGPGKHRNILIVPRER